MATDSSTFPEGDAEADELNPGQTKNFEIDPVSSEIAADKVEKTIEKRANAKAKRDTSQTLKNTIIISAVIVAVAGAAFAITKKMKENK